MNKIVVFGAGAVGKSLYARFKDICDIVIVDNDPQKQENGVLAPQVLKKIDFNLVFICVAGAVNCIYSQLTNELGVPQHKIMRFFGDVLDDTANLIDRVRWLEPFSTYLALKKVNGAVAEVGVLKGEYSVHISRVFPDRTLYLFDTFEGYDEKDFTVEAQKNTVSRDYFEGIRNNPLPETNIELVLGKLIYPEKAIIKKGYFPDTFDIEDEKFAFVFLDLNLYKPIKSGLEIFYPLMSKGGVILVHDYFYGTQNGVAAAVDEFLYENDLVAVPCADCTAIAIVKN